MSDKAIDWSPTGNHWGVVSKTLHWIVAFLIIGLLIMGNFMTGLPNEPQEAAQEKFELYQVHKSFGFTVLALVFVRILWRLTARSAPRLPSETPAWQRAGAHFSHFGLYALMILMPITGWFMVSASTEVKFPTFYFNLFEIPHLTGPDSDLSEAMHAAHAIFGWALVAILLLHVGAACKHLFINRDGVFSRILPGRTASASAGVENEPHSGGGIFVFFGVLVLAIAASGYGLVSYNSAGSGGLQQIEPTSGSGGWTVDMEQTTLGFSFDQYGETKTGVFERFNSDITFDPDDLSTAKAIVIIDIASVTLESGSDTSTAESGEWLSADAFPSARFETTAFRSTGDGTYEADATLTIRDQSKPITLPFSLTIDGAEAKMTGSVALDRKSFEVGDSDDVSAEVTVTIDLTANKSE